MTSPDKVIQDRNQKSYIAEYSAPKIILPELDKCETQRQVNLTHKIETRLNELKKEYESLVDLYSWNQFVETFEIRLEPVMGQKYYLYERDDNTRFLSLIDPKSFFVKYTFLGCTTLNSEGYFIKLDYV